MNARATPLQFIQAAPGYFALDFDCSKPADRQVTKMAVIAWALSSDAAPFPVTLDGTDCVLGPILQPDGTVLSDYGILDSLETWVAKSRAPAVQA